VELLTASHDVPGSRLLDLVAVMDRLRSPGGCPWDAEQTHASLLPYLLEEAHEVVEAVESLPAPGSREHLREELGDLLLQVVFHARVAQEDPAAPFGDDDVAAGIVAKLVRRHPHVFGGPDAAAAADAGEVAANWEQLKAAEKQRTGLFEGIPGTLPALARATKMLGRLERAGRLDDAALAGAADGDEVALGLLRLVHEAGVRGVDAEAALRAALSRLARGEKGPDGQPEG
jgi:XTP/dITP diphosphohydrolase